MSLQPYVFPPFPSPQVKAVQECLKCISEFDIDGLHSLMTDDFTLKMLPENLGVPDRTKAVAFAGLKEMQASLNGKPLAVSRSQTHRGHPFGTNHQSARQYTVYDVTDGQGKTWVHVPLFSGTHKLELTLIPHLGKDRPA